MQHLRNGRSRHVSALAQVACLSGVSLWIALLTPAVLHAQNDENATTAAPAGIQVRSLSVFGVYYSNGAPVNGGIPVGGSNFSSDYGFGGSAEFDWTRFTERSSFSMTYTPSYSGRVRYSSLDALNHSFSLNASHHLAPRWNFRVSAAAVVSTLEQSLFAPTTLSTVAALPTTFQDLSAGLLQSQFNTNPQLGSLLTAAVPEQSPLNTLLYGQRMLSASAGTSLSYSYSPRLSLTFDVGGGRTQPLSDSGSSIGAGSLALETTTGHAGLSLAYSYSPRTQITAMVTTSRTASGLFDDYTTTTLVSIGRTFAQRWILQVHGGAGVAIPVREVGIPSSVTPFPSGGASLTYKTTANTFMASYDHTETAAYGLGASTTSTASATWRWRMPGRTWWIDSTFGYQQLQGNSLGNTTGWRSTTGFNQALNPHLSLRAEYAYLKYSGGFISAIDNLAQSAVRFSLIWSPLANAVR